MILSKCRFMFEKIMPLTDAVEGYHLFDKAKVQKVVFQVGSASETER